MTRAPFDLRRELQPPRAAKTPTVERLSFGVAEAARALGVSAKTVSRLVAAGTLRSVRIGGRRLIPADELRRLLTPPESAA